MTLPPHLLLTVSGCLLEGETVCQHAAQQLVESCCKHYTWGPHLQRHVLYHSAAVHGCWVGPGSRSVDRNGFAPSSGQGSAWVTSLCYNAVIICPCNGVTSSPSPLMHPPEVPKAGRSWSKFSVVVCFTFVWASTTVAFSPCGPVCVICHDTATWPFFHRHSILLSLDRPGWRSRDPGTGPRRRTNHASPTSATRLCCKNTFHSVSKRSRISEAYVRYATGILLKLAHAHPHCRTESAAKRSNTKHARSTVTTNHDASRKGRF